MGEERDVVYASDGGQERRLDIDPDRIILRGSSAGAVAAAQDA